MTPVDFEATQQRLTAMQMGGRHPGVDSLSAGFLLRGLGECALCGHRVSSHAATPGGTIRHGGWYECGYHACPGIGALRHDRVDEAMSGLVLEQLELLIDALANPKAAPVADAPDWAALRARVETRRARLVEAIADGVLTSDVARAKMAALASELSALAARELASAPRVAPPALLAGALDDAAKIRRAWRHVLPAGRREVVGILAKGVVVGREGRGAVLGPRWRAIGDPSGSASRPGQILRGEFAALTSVLSGRWAS